jgi:hypothetical protein
MDLLRLLNDGGVNGGVNGSVKASPDPSERRGDGDKGQLI